MTLFQSTRPRGRTRLVTVPIIAIILLFQSTRPRGRTRPGGRAVGGCPPGFNPRVLAGGRDTRLSFRTLSLSGFNPRVLAGGRDTGVRRKVITRMFQSTRPRGRTRQIFVPKPLIPNCFNPRVLAGGRDSLSFRRFQADFCFNPRVLAGGRDSADSIRYFCPAVSIHASSREDATCA